MMNETGKKKNDDTVFNKVNRFISLQDQHVAEINPLLDEVLKIMLEMMKKEDSLFRYMYRETMFAGSYWKGTKVGKPDEFDLDLILTLPVDYNKIKFEDDRPGYARIKLPADSLKPDWETHKKILNKWISYSQNYLNNDKLRRWFESVVARTFSRLGEREDEWFLLQNGGNIKVKTKKSGPAFTLQVDYNGVKFDVDLVPVLEFKTRPKLPVFNKVPIGELPWYLVPKPLKIGTNTEFCWRFCFYRYEKAMLSISGKIKPVIRHLKKLKDCQNWSSVLASYYIETLVYHELIAGTLNLSRSSMSVLLVHMLTKLNEACEKQDIPYYWDPRCNLLAEKTAEQLLPIRKRMEKIIKVIRENPQQTIEFFLTDEERTTFALTSTPPSTPNSDEPVGGNSWVSTVFNLFRSLVWN